MIQSKTSKRLSDFLYSTSTNEWNKKFPLQNISELTSRKNEKYKEPNKGNKINIFNIFNFF